jgi:hypothetical protein
MLRPQVFLYFISFSLFGQPKIDNDKIENFCFELHNTLRNSSRQRTVNLDCKKASNYQVNYLFQNNLITHDNINTGYESPSDRFEKFMSEIVRVKDRNNPKLIHTQLKYAFDGEIASWSNGYEFKIDSLLEFNIANYIIKGFINSPGHYGLMIRVSCCDYRQNGYFSTKIKVLEYNENSKTCRLEIYCVAVFGSEYPYKDVYVYDPSTGKMED